MSPLWVATRGSPLALRQAEHVRALLQAQEPGLQVELLVLRTTGDRVQDRPLQDLGGKGLFTKEIEEALLDGRAAIAVHSMKDLPAAGPAGLCIGAVPPRQDPRDALLLRPGLRDGGPGLAALPPGARVGTTSLRRACLLRHLRPDLHIEPLRGNVDTRLRRLEAGELDAVVLAAAGLIRLGHSARIDAILPVDELIPAVGQGALAVQCRSEDAATRARLSALDHPPSRVAIAAERAFLAQLEGSCRTPLGAHAVLADGELSIQGFVGRPDGSQILRARLCGPPSRAEELGQALARQLLAEGGEALLRDLGL
ncbi:MAG: hydroxymethylbilane synthase [Myxococcales bacterium]|nr:hydroxymethylbilane synthase [Myxococcota bacterium]MDW8283567.1 hydroxymethylbilane synthase [Myxococcales bacterium]